ncbi:hypothetical protein MKHDV_01728 [Halodesulfovibrio sp. MK-HDV]|nr:hypothetical protein MKHDV_01728 [Halodesulfovibrio sp. MK-HDV]
MPPALLSKFKIMSLLFITLQQAPYVSPTQKNNLTAILLGLVKITLWKKLTPKRYLLDVNFYKKIGRTIRPLKYPICLQAYKA